MAPKLYRAAEVCELAQLQSYVLRSWDKEFPGIGLQKSADSVRLYRQADVDQVLRIKQLVFGEGLTLAGARRRLEETAAAARTPDEEVAEVLDALASDARMRIAHVRDGLRSLLSLLSKAPGSVVLVDDYQLTPPAMDVASSKLGKPKSHTMPSRPNGNRKSAAPAPVKRKRATA